jgi:hypothetical protein
MPVLAVPGQFGIAVEARLRQARSAALRGERRISSVVSVLRRVHTSAPTVHASKRGLPAMPLAAAPLELRGPNDESLFARPLSEVTILDPYLATEWQLKLLAELISLAKSAGCKKVTVHTYAPKERDEGNGYGVNRTCTAAEQLRGMRKLLADEKWKPMSAPLRPVERVHKRVLMGVRVDGTKFEVLFERGIDFFHEGFRGGRATRETHRIIRDPL